MLLKPSISMLESRITVLPRVNAATEVNVVSSRSSKLAWSNFRARAFSETMRTLSSG